MTTPAQPPARGGRGNKFPSMRSPVTWVLILGVALGGGAYLLYRRNKASAAAATAATPTPDTTDVSGQIATLQAEIADLQSSFTQGETGETGTGTGGGGDNDGGGGGTAKLVAPGGFSITPHSGYADFGWGRVPGAKAYELQVAGTAPRPGPSHYDHAGADNHAERVALAKGNYHARVRAGKSTAALTGPWTEWKPFTMGASRNPAPGGGRLVTGRVGSNGSSGESENDTGSG